VILTELLQDYDQGLDGFGGWRGISGTQTIKTFKGRKLSQNVKGSEPNLSLNKANLNMLEVGISANFYACIIRLPIKRFRESVGHGLYSMEHAPQIGSGDGCLNQPFLTSSIKIWSPTLYFAEQSVHKIWIQISVSPIHQLFHCHQYYSVLEPKAVSLFY
jgi:hypothetical protein